MSPPTPSTLLFYCFWFGFIVKIHLLESSPPSAPPSPQCHLPHLPPYFFIVSVHQFSVHPPPPPTPQYHLPHRQPYFFIVSDLDSFVKIHLLESSPPPPPPPPPVSPPTPSTLLFYCFWFGFIVKIHLLESPPPPPRPPPPPSVTSHTFHPTFLLFHIWILCQNSLTRELKIRVVGFVLKKLFTPFETLFLYLCMQI